MRKEEEEDGQARGGETEEHVRWHAGHLNAKAEGRNGVEPMLGLHWTPWVFYLSFIHWSI